MASHADAESFARAIAERAVKVNRSVQVASEEVGDRLLTEARRLTSGALSTRQLAQMGHPYARSRGLAGAALLPVNVQSGSLVRGWRKFRRPGAAGGEGAITWQIQNVSPHARLAISPGGTRTVLPRGLQEVLRAFAEVELRRGVQAAIHDAAQEQD